MRIRVPATSANLGPGFDTLGMALQFYNHFEATPTEAMTVRLSPSTCVDVEGLSLTPEDNLFSRAYQAYFRFRKTPLIPANLVIEAHVPLSRGMGGSSSAIVAGLYLADGLHPEPLGKNALLPWAIELEGHPDNVVPALMGGVHCCLSDGASFTLNWPQDWGILLVIPPTPLSTEQARSVMPTHYSQLEAIENVRGMAAWIYALTQQDEALFRYALAADTLHQPARETLIPEFTVLKQLLHRSQALGCIISGAGSTLAVYTPNAEVHQEVQTLLKGHPDLAHCKIIAVKPDQEGVTPTPLKAY